MGRKLVIGCEREADRPERAEVALEIVDTISHETVRQVLKKIA